MTQAPAADIVERLRKFCGGVGLEAATEIEALRARETELLDDVRIWKSEAVQRSQGMIDLNLDRADMSVRLMEAEEANAALQRKLDEAVKSQNEALALIDEINERGASRRFYGIDQPLHAKICTIRATLVRWQALASIRGETD